MGRHFKQPFFGRKIIINNQSVQEEDKMILHTVTAAAAIDPEKVLINLKYAYISTTVSCIAQF